MSASPAVKETLESIASGEVPPLRHVATDDRSKPIIGEDVHVRTWDKDGLLHAIEGGVPLKHVSTDDRSIPHIDEGVKVQPSNRKGLLTEIQAAAHHRQAVHEIKEAAGSIQLHHVEQVADRSSPVISPDVHVNTWDKAKFLQEVASPHHLNHVEQVKDRSSPATEGAHVGRNPLPDVLQQITSGEVSAKKLHHVAKEEIHDASVPMLPKQPSLQPQGSA